MVDSDNDQTEKISDENAASVIQRAWRRRQRRRNGVLDVQARREEVAIHAKLQTQREAANQRRNDSLSRWKRAAFLAGRLGGATDEGHQLAHDEWRQHSQTTIEGSHLQASYTENVKILETQHWLELTDSKHRYGSNLKYYHKRWLQEDTEDDFFKWLDRGAGKGVSLRECPRDQLEKERIIYLSAEQRLNYRVTVDSNGRLRWARSNELVDTTAGRWQDSGDGSGIVRFDASRRGHTAVRHRTSFNTDCIGSDSTEVPDSNTDNYNATHYVESKDIINPLKRWFRRHLTIKGWTEILLKKTIRRNTWIYVADKQFNIYIGIKDTGTFQHSSFLSGGLVTSAGLISVHKGVIHKLSPLSGHYRTSIDHFRNFIKALSEMGVDLHRAGVSKAEAALWGIEHIKKAEKKLDELEKRGKDKTKRITEKVSEQKRVLDDESHWRKDILEGRKKKNQGGSSESGQQV